MARQPNTCRGPAIGHLPGTDERIPTRNFNGYAEPVADLYSPDQSEKLLMYMQRVWAVIAAVLLVASVAIATCGSQSLSLGQALVLLDHDLAGQAIAATKRIIGNRAWDTLVEPLMMRPDWLIPAFAGIISLGLALSFSGRNSARRSHRRS